MATRKKKKLLSAKEARELVESQRAEIGNLQIQLHNRKEELKSMTTARDNCKIMMEHAEGLAKIEAEKVSELRAALKIETGKRQQAEAWNIAAQKSLNVHNNRTAAEHLRRAYELIRDGMRVKLRNMVARCRF